MKETNIQQLIRMEASRLGAILWRNNVGMFKTQDDRIVKTGLCVGSSDLIGMYKGKFLAIEVKQPNKKPTQSQMNFIKTVQDNGGIAGVARSPEDVKKILDGVMCL